jgi:hypothetical protein
MRGPAKRGVWAGIAFLAVCAITGVYIGAYLVNVPGSSAATQGPSGAQLYLATVPAAATTDPHPTWVSYYSVDANHQHWRHVTTYVLPAHALVHVTIFQFDSDTGLRNPFISQAQGTVGGNFTLNGKTMNAINPNDASHVFAIPAIGLAVPLEGISSSAKNPCSNAPCSGDDYQTIKFTFRTPAKGLYRWQCFVPCAAGYIDGLGGPMQTVGYMDGYIKVV